ncbi:hypothetical protein HPP92_015898 [Vanilla planifolia]|uniref:Biogenesis factor required for ATP synthase 1-like C-terminal domain-containing protein n=1 Tax=Vanilla planifolia TaxID=51239 RepID=A0A835UW81_VANPL|nr:hypothetical protein HPP92_015898 [Vanilla planifolia]
MRVRAFHVMDPKGILEMLLIFVEQRGDATPSISSLFSSVVPEKITPFLGKWKGHSITKRTGVYGATIEEAETVTLLDLHGNGQLIQGVTLTCSASASETKVHWCGTLSDNLITFDGGFQVTLLPGGMYMGCPVDIGKSVAELQSFHLEFCWMESPGTRQRLIRTYDKDGLAVSSTYILETKA